MILAKFYENWSVYSQEFIEDVVKIEFDLFTFWVANFSISINNNMKEKQKVELIEVDSIGQDKLIFSWYIYTINPIRKQFRKISIELRSEKAFFDEILVLSDINISWNVSNIQNLFNQYNIYWLNYVISSDIADTIELLEIKTWDTFFSVMDAIAQQFTAYRDIEWNVVKLSRMLWVDRTTGSNYTEAYFNWLYPSENNIKEITWWSVSQRFNVLIAVNQTTKQVLSNYAGLFYWSRLQEFRDWTIANQAQEFLNNGDKDKRNYKFEIEENTITADVWDKIKVIVQNTNQYFDIDTSCMVTNKIIEYKQWKKVSYQFQEFPTQTLTTENFNRRISQQIAYNIIK